MEHYLLKDLAIVTASAAIAHCIARLLKIPALLGYIVVGILLCPAVLGFLHDGQNLEQIGELGVLFMMFFIGLEFNLDKLKKLFVPSTIAMIFQIISMLILGITIGDIFGLSSIEGIFLGATLSISSTIVIMELLAKKKAVSKNYGQVTIGILIFEDLFAIFLIVMVSSSAVTGDGSNSLIYDILQRCLVLFSFVIAIFIVGKFALTYLIRKTTILQNSQLLIMFIFCIILGIGELAHLAQLSQALGAFLAGSIISGSSIANRVEHLSSPFKSLFVALFFISLGTKIDPMLIVDNYKIILAVTFPMMIFRSIASFLGIVFAGYTAKDAFMSAITKSQIGEFSFIVVGIGIANSVIDNNLMSIVMGVCFLSVFISAIVSDKALAIYNISSKIVPNKISLLFKFYHKSIETFKNSAKQKVIIKRITMPLFNIAIFIILFNALMILSLAFLKYISSLEFYNDYIGYALWAIVASISVPLVLAILNNIKGITEVFFLIITKNRSLKSNTATKLTSVLRGIFSLLVSMLFGAIFFGIILYHYERQDVVFYYAVFTLILVILFGGFFSKIYQNLQHSFLDILNRHLKNAKEYRQEKFIERIKSQYSWIVNIHEVHIAEDSFAAGKTIEMLKIRSQTKCDIIAIKRSRFVIYDIEPNTGIYPDDYVILNGDKLAIKKAESILTKHESSEKDEEFEMEVNLQHFEIPADSSLIGQSLAGANIAKMYAVRIMGIETSDNARLKPEANYTFKANDKIITMADPEKLKRFQEKYLLIEE